MGKILRSPTAHTIHASKPELIVGLPLTGVGEHVVGLGRLLESLLGGLIARISVGVIADRELAVSLLYVIERGALVDAKYFIVIPLGQPLTILPGARLLLVVVVHYFVVDIFHLAALACCGRTSVLAGAVRILAS